MAVEKDHVEAMINLAWLNFITKANKKEALSLLNRALQKTGIISNTYVNTMVLIWNDQIEQGIDQARDFIENKEMIANFSMGIEPFLMLLIAKKEYDYVHQLFVNNQFQSRDVYKPIYYALMYYMRDIFPDEHKRMGEELVQTVEEIINHIDQMRIEYS